MNYQVEISRLQTFGMRKLLYLWPSWLVVIMVNWPLYWHPMRSLSVHLHWVHPKQNISKVLLLHDATPHKHMHIIEVITNFRWSISASTLQSWPCTVILSPFCSWWGGTLWGHHYANDEPPRKAVHQWLLRRENSFYQTKIYTPVQSWEKTVNKVETTLKNNYAFSSNILWNFHMFSECPLC